ncbi:MAG: UbiD family decarboxylase [Desulfobacterales bacterium]|nr:UbiD family decarboxylase [Desulfobacterales bacterium]
MFDDLREFINKADELGLVDRIDGAEWDLEIGRISELQLTVPDAPMLLFDRIKGYPAGFRVLTNFLNTERLINLTLGFPLEAKRLEIVKILRDKLQGEIPLIPPMEVDTGPVMENILTGDAVDLFKFPVPRWAELDGGRFIGTGDSVIQKDPDSGWVNIGTYRVQVHDKTTATIYMSPGKHGDVIRRKFWDRGESCPVAVVCGCDPLMWSAGYSNSPLGISELDFAGGLRGKPVEVLRSRLTDLPIPARAEIILEGELLPPGADDRSEGPFGEYTGHYASGARNEPAFKVKRILHRNDPIILGHPPQVGRYKLEDKLFSNSAVLWNQLDRRVPGIQGVWYFHESNGPSMIAISVKQMYAGHAKTAGTFAAGYLTEAEPCRWIIVVDDDIDPSNIAEVLWAMGQRCDPATGIDVISGLCACPLSPTATPEMRRSRNYTHSRAILLACKPYEWIDAFPPSIKSSPAVMKKVKEKWGKVLYGQT